MYFCRSATSRSAGKLNETALHSVLEGENAELRAALVLAQIAGFQLMSQVIQIDALKNAGARRLSTLLIRMFDHQLRVGN